MRSAPTTAVSVAASAKWARPSPAAVSDCEAGSQDGGHGEHAPAPPGCFEVGEQLVDDLRRQAP